MQNNSSVILSENEKKDISIFSNPEFGSVRTVELNGKIYFCGSDVAKALGYSNPRDAILRHCKGVVKHDGVSKTTNQYGVVSEQISTMSFIPEGDVYRLIVSSKLPSAQKFESWVFDEVLPTIRKSGSYTTVPKTLQEALRAYADELDRAEKLQLENKQLNHALEYDKIVGWKPWNKIKADWREDFVELQHKVNFKEIIEKADLIKGVDYIEKVMGFDKFPTKMISASGEEKLWNYFDR